MQRAPQGGYWAPQSAKLNYFTQSTQTKCNFFSDPSQTYDLMRWSEVARIFLQPCSFPMIQYHPNF